MRRATEINVEIEEGTDTFSIHFITFENCERVKKVIEAKLPASIGRVKRVLRTSGYNARAKDITI